MFPICQSVILSVIESRLDHTTMSLSSLFKHNSNIMKPWESLPEQRKDTPLQTRRYPLGLPTIVTRQKIEQVKAKNLSHGSVKENFLMQTGTRRNMTRVQSD